MGAEAIAADVLDVVGTIGTSVAPNVPWTCRHRGACALGHRVLRCRGACAEAFATTRPLSAAVQPWLCETLWMHALTARLRRRTACRTCGGKGFVGVAPCPDCKGPAAALWGHED